MNHRIVPSAVVSLLGEIRVNFEGGDPYLFV